jgi:hypothetical protein
MVIHPEVIPHWGYFWVGGDPDRMGQRLQISALQYGRRDPF